VPDFSTPLVVATPAALPHTDDPDDVFETRPAADLARIALEVWRTRTRGYRARPYAVELTEADLVGDPDTAAIITQLARHGRPWVRITVTAARPTRSTP